MMKRLPAFLIVCTVVAAPLFASTTIRHHNRSVVGRYMVLLDPTISASAYNGIVNSLARSYNATVTTEWREEPRGFICDNVNTANAERLATDPRVRIVEEDFQFSVATSGMQWTSWNNNYLWHLDRLDEPTYATHDSQYDMCPEAREITAYLVDIGVRADHEQFTLNEPSGRVDSYAFDDGSTGGYADQTNGCTASGSTNFNRWHGTAVASVIGGTTTGAAKVHIVSLRIATCGGGGLASYIVNAIRWIRSTSDPKSGTPGVVSMSTFIGDWQSDFVTLSDTVDARVKATGIPFFASANNFSADACKFTPANLTYTNVNRLSHRSNPSQAGGTVFSVGGTSLGGNNTNDYRWQTWDNSLAAIGQDTGSNGGSCVSIYAPAADIYAARTTSTTAYAVASGTSFSAPLTAAIAARYIAKTGVSTYQDVYDYLLSVAGSSSLINNVSTPEYWMCNQGYPSYTWVGYRTDPGVCPAGQTGYGTTPVHFTATSNTSNAGMLYSPMSCP
jgi:hypothetical protein